MDKELLQINTDIPHQTKLSPLNSKTVARNESETI